MPLRVRTTGCMWSIILSIALTLVLNLAIRSC